MSSPTTLLRSPTSPSRSSFFSTTLHCHFSPHPTLNSFLLPAPNPRNNVPSRPPSMPRCDVLISQFSSCRVYDPSFLFTIFKHSSHSAIVPMFKATMLGAPLIHPFVREIFVTFRKFPSAPYVRMLLFVFHYCPGEVAELQDDRF